MKLQPPKDRLRLEAAPETEVEVGSPVWERLALLNPVLLLPSLQPPPGAWVSEKPQAPSSGDTQNCIWYRSKLSRPKV